MLPGLGPDARIDDLKWSAGRPTLLSWVDTETQRYYLASVSSTQALTHIVRIDSSVDAASLRDGVMVDDQHLVGTMLLPLGPALGDPARRETIVELDLATGAVVPLIQPEILTSLGAGELQVLAVMDRPFIRIAAQGDCLNVRTGSSTAMPTLGCYKDGVLLADRGRIARHNGDIWIAVTTPDGKDGWANGAFLDLAGHDLGPTPAVKVNTGLPEIDAIVAALSTGDMAQILPLVGFTPVACTVNPQGIGAPPQCPAGVPEGTPINVFPSGACEGYYILPDQLRFDPVGSMPLFAVVRWHPFIREGYSAPGDYEILFKNTSFNPPSTTSVFVGDGKIIRTAYGCGQPLDQALQGVAPEDILYRAP
jgi:hypothetical protein